SDQKTAAPRSTTTRDFIPEPRPDLSGKLMKHPDFDPIYLIDPQGFRRWFPNPETLHNLCGASPNVETERLLADIAETTPIEDGAVLFKGDQRDEIFLTDHRLKRWITSPAVMVKYQFDKGDVKVVPQRVADS